MPRTSKPKPSQQSPNRNVRLTLSWKCRRKNGTSLVFDKTAWPLFEEIAKKRGIDPEEMISVAVVQLLGRINSYRLRA